MSSDSGSSVSEERSGWEWWATALVAVAAFGFGFTGMREYELWHGGLIDLWSIVYHTLQLFILHAPHMPPIPWQLHVGRFLGALPICITTFLAFIRIFPDEWNLTMLRLPWTRGQVVICGLGDIGRRLAAEGRKRKKRVNFVSRPIIRRLLIANPFDERSRLRG